MKGFGFLFDTDSKFGKAMGKIYLIVITNILFIAFSLPIVTIGASYTALCHVMLKTLRSQREVRPLEEFWEGFKSNFKQATIAWLIAVALLVFGYLDMFWSSQIGGLSLYLQLPIATMMCMIIVLLFYLFPTIAAFQNNVLNLVKNAIYFIMIKPWISLAIVCCNIIPLALLILDQVNQPTYVFGFFFFGFALITMISMNLISKTFYSKHVTVE